MNAILDTTIVLGKILYYFSESLVYKVIPKRKKNVTGEIVLITGAGSGIGRLMAIKFASLGAILVLWDINEKENMKTCRLAKQKGDEKVFAYKCDCSNRQEVYKVANQVKEEVGDVTILINNAGIMVGKLFLDTTDEMVERSFHINVLAHFWTCKAFLPAMIKANHGHLVCIASAAGLIGISGLSEYCASKYAAVGFAESLSYELKLVPKSKIKTTIICPFFIKTGMFEGVTTKFSFLLPMLEQEYVVQKIINAILDEQFYLLIPRFVSFGLFLKQILSPKMILACIEYFGLDNCMAPFREKNKANDVSTEAEKERRG